MACGAIACGSDSSAAEGERDGMKRWDEEMRHNSFIASEIVGKKLALVR